MPFYTITSGNEINLGKPGRYAFTLYSLFEGDAKGEVITLSGGFNIEEDNFGFFRFNDEPKLTVLDDGFRLNTEEVTLVVEFKQPLDKIKMPELTNAFTLDEFEGILNFPEQVHVHHKLFLKDIWYLGELPKKLVVKGSCTISECFSLVEIPEDWHIEGSADFSYNPKLHEVKCKSFNDLDLTDCDELTTLPSGLKVKWSLNLTDCVSLTELPPDLTVGGDLLLSGSGVRRIPDTVHVGGKIIRKY